MKYIFLILFFAGCSTTHYEPITYVKPEFAGSVGTLVSGTSMEPLISVGEKYYVDHTKYCDLKIGDVVVRKYGEQTFVHQIIGPVFNKKNWTTKGINNQFADSLDLTMDDYLGRVSLILKKDGEIIEL